MADQTVTLQFKGQSSSAKAAAKETASAIKDINKSADEAKGHFTEMRKAILSSVAAFVGLQTGARLIESTVKAALDAQAANQLLAQQLKNVGLSYDELKPKIDKTLDSMSRMSGFGKTELTQALTSLVRVTHDEGKAQTDLALAVDIARQKHIDLESATQIVTKAQIGLTGALRRMGIDIKPVTDNIDALKAAHTAAAAEAAKHGEKVAALTAQQIADAKAADQAATSTKALAELHKSSAGAAEAYGNTSAGAMDRFRAAVEELQIKIGNGLLPIITSAAQKGVRFADNWDKAGTSANEVHHAVDELATILKEFFRDTNDVVHALGGWNKALEGLALTMAGFKLASWIQSIATLAGNFATVSRNAKMASTEIEATGAAATAAAAETATATTAAEAEVASVGTAAVAAEGEVAALGTALSGLATAGVVIPIVLAITYRQQITDAVGGAMGWLRKKLGDNSQPQQLTWAQYQYDLAHGITDYGVSDPYSLQGAPPRPPTTSSTEAAAKAAHGKAKVTPGKTLPLAGSFTATHETAGLAGFPALDVSYQPGERVLAPENGTIMDPHFIEWDEQKRVGGWTIYFQGYESGDTYFLTHFSWVASAGPVKKGDIIGIAAAVPHGWWQSHIHEGVHVGAYTPGSAGTTTPTTPTFATSPKDRKGPAPPSMVAVRQAREALGQLGQELKTSGGSLPDVLSAPIEKMRDQVAKLLDAAHPSAKQLADANRLLSEAKKDLENALKFDDVVKATSQSTTKLQGLLKSGLIPADGVAAVRKNIAAFKAEVKADLKDGVITDAELKKITADGKTLQTTYKNALDLQPVIRQAKTDSAELNADLRSGFADGPEAKAVTAAMTKYHADLVAVWKDGVLTDAEKKKIEADAKTLHDDAKAIADDLKQQQQTVAQELGQLGDTILSEGQSAGLALGKIYTPTDIQGLADRAKKLTAALKFGGGDALKAQLDGVNSQIKTGLDQLVATIGDDKQKVADAWTAFGALVEKTFQTDVADKFQKGVDSVTKTLNDAELASTIADDQTAFSDALAKGNAELGQLMQTQVGLWQQYYADLAAGDFDGAKALVGSIVAGEKNIKTALAGLPDDQKTAGQAIVDAGNTLIGDLKTQGQEATQTAVDNWAKLTSAQHDAIMGAIQQAQADVDSGKKTLPEALAGLRQVFIDNGLSPADADSVLADPITSALSTAVTALTTAIGDLTTLLAGLASALGLSIPGLNTRAQGAADAVTGPWKQAAIDMISYADTIVAAARFAAGYTGPVGGPQLPDMPGYNGFWKGGIIPGLVAKAFGGMVLPGPINGVDHYPILASGGEMVLTPKQQQTLFHLAQHGWAPGLGPAGLGAGYDFRRLEARVEALQHLLATRDGWHLHVGDVSRPELPAYIRYMTHRVSGVPPIATGS